MRRIPILAIILGILVSDRMQASLFAQDVEVVYRVYYELRESGEVRKSRGEYDTKDEAEEAAEELRQLHRVSDAWVEKVRIKTDRSDDVASKLQGTRWGGRINGNPFSLSFDAYVKFKVSGKSETGRVYDGKVITRKDGTIVIDLTQGTSGPANRIVLAVELKGDRMDGDGTMTWYDPDSTLNIYWGMDRFR
jgi:hypothetical protein